MLPSTRAQPLHPAPISLKRFFVNVRAASHKLVTPLSDADATVQSMPDASPAKWHLAHTTWFFETMILAPNMPDYRVFDERFGFLFNSYYESIGARHARPKRGLLTRPSLEMVLAYRSHVDEAVAALLDQNPASEIAALIELGCHHEQQHQELLLTDILHLFAQNSLAPAYKDPEPLAVDPRPTIVAGYTDFDGGIIEIGHGGSDFAFDCEGPRHSLLIEPFRMANRLTTNREWMDFIADGGYRNPLLWLSEGWARVTAQSWSAPLYWENRDNTFLSMTLRGLQPIDPDAPVAHVSYFEADAFATWSGGVFPRKRNGSARPEILPLMAISSSQAACVRAPH